ncbi:NACHT, LRR and PYD domains-containing protein 12-like isoform X3 [Erinaceus europaeus]|uniref:NACHT, LRR and PYD domains-containing protein 12-like isoform X3 n=1 Tax=Erinaceus europaeus TaxID=9365 RepID=A0ABM3WRG4_ERIEU|nr:NACHT, LRR and PYD domains-containing protein 12-like isoform X3 [Erinaceus europaeus]
MKSQKKRKDMEPACTWSLLSEKKDYREVFRKHLKEKYLRIGVDKFYHHGKYIESRLLIVKEYGVSEKTCGIPQQDNFIKMQHLFDPDEEGFSSSQTVVLQGCAGVGKTALVHKFMFDWAAGMVTPGRFDYLIYVNCREICHIASLSAADLIANTFEDIDGPILDVVLMYPEKLLFILDGFPEIQNPVGDQEEDICTDPQERKTVETLLCSFVTKKLLPESSLLITARPTTVKKLQSRLKKPMQVEVLWFTDAEKRAYFLSQFLGASTAIKVFHGLQEIEKLDILTSLPIISWMVCSALSLRGDNDRTPLRSLQTLTDMYLFYFSKCLKTLTGISVWKGQSCLWGLCSLAAEGLHKQKVLFEVSELRRHGIGVYDISCPFLNHFLKKTKGNGSTYTFLHFSFQEFLTAVFYVLKNSSSWMVFPHGGETWQEIFQRFGKGFSSLTIQFLFGLLHKEKESALETTFGRKTSPRLREELIKWTEKETKNKSSRLLIEPVDLFHCLYEIQEEEYAKKIIDDLQSIILLQPTYTKMDLLAMSFCVKNSQSPLSFSLKCQHLLGFEEEVPASLLTLPASTFDWPFELPDLPSSPLHFLCQALRHPYCKIKDLKLIFCHLTASCGKDLSLVFETNQYLTELEFVKNTLEDSGMMLLCQGLKQPNCILQTLRLYRCLISPASCGALAAVLSTNQWLMELEFSETKLEASALKLLCEGLKDPNCKLQKLKLSDSVSPDTSETLCKYLASVLICNTNLIDLDLSENPLGDEGVKYLCEGLKHSNCKVEKLELWTCHLTGKCCQDLRNALYTNEHLRDLDLSDNALGDRGIQVMCEGLKHSSCRLQNLWLADCHLTDVCCGALASVLNRNDNLTLLDLCGNDLKDFGVQILCDALSGPVCKLQTLYIDTDNLHEETYRKLNDLKLSKPGFTW